MPTSSARYADAIARLSGHMEGMALFGETIKRLLKSMVPMPPMTPYEWAGKYRKLSKKAAASSGQWDNDRTPYLREILEAYANPDIENIAFKSGVQLSKTEGLLNNIIGYHIHMNPCVMMLVMPNEKLLDTYRTTKLQPMFEATDAFYNEKRVQRAKPGSAKTNKFRISFDNGDLLLGNGGSKSDASSVSLPVVLVDEAAKLPYDPVEGNMLPLFEGRTTTYVGKGKKFVVTSTPTDENCIMEAEYLLGDQRKYKVPCPKCGARQFLEWPNMERDKTIHPDGTKQHHAHTAWYRCAAKGCKITEAQRYGMNLAGVWEATAVSSSPKRVSFHLSTLYSPFVTFEYIVQYYLDKMRSPDGLGMRTFKNQMLGEIFVSGATIRPSHTALMERAASAEKPYKLGEVPPQVGFITMGGDVQELEGGYIDMSTWGYGPNNQRWLVDRAKIYGHYSNPKTWEEVDKFRRKVYRVSDGREMRAMRVCIDSSYGLSTDFVYDYARKRQNENVFALKGGSNSSAPLLTISQTEKNQLGQKAGDGISLFIANVHSMKMGLYSSLNTIKDPVDPFYIHLPIMDADLYKQLTAESLSTVNGQLVFLKKYDRNELIDTCSYSLAGAVHMGIERYTPEMWAELYRLQGVEMPFDLSTPQAAERNVEIETTYRVMVHNKWYPPNSVLHVTEADAMALCDVPDAKARRVESLPDAPKPVPKPIAARKPAIPKGFRRKTA